MVIHSVIIFCTNAIKKHTSGPASLHRQPPPPPSSPSPLSWCNAGKRLCDNGSGGLLLQGAGTPGSGVTLQACKLEKRVTIVSDLVVGNIPSITCRVEMYEDPHQNSAPTSRQCHSDSGGESRRRTRHGGCRRRSLNEPAASVIVCHQGPTTTTSTSQQQNKSSEKSRLRPDHIYISDIAPLIIVATKSLDANTGVFH